MARSMLEALIDDSTIVAEVGVRIGALADDDDLPKALDAAIRSSGAALPDSEVVRDLSLALNSAMKKIAPITLDDLRRGWRPYRSSRRFRLGKVAFFFFSILMMWACAFTTQVYERARVMYSTTLELQQARGAEQAMRLFGMLKRNQQEVLDSLNSGKKEFLYEVFSKSLFDLKAMYLKNQAYLPIAAKVLNDLDMISSPSEAFKRIQDSQNPSGSVDISKLIAQKGYGQAPTEATQKELMQLDVSGRNLAEGGVKIKNGNVDAQVLLEQYLNQLRRFNLSINFFIDPVQPNDYFSNLFQLQIGIGFVGQWVLPALYGMLGASIFYMRRLLDPIIPDPSFMRITFRLLLGGFAGIIIVWFWTPSSQRPSQGEFATLTSFGIAFIVGYSTDVFFRALDRMVEYLTQAVGGSAGTT